VQFGGATRVGWGYLLWDRVGRSPLRRIHSSLNADSLKNPSQIAHGWRCVEKITKVEVDE